MNLARLSVLRAGERTSPSDAPVANKLLLSVSDHEYRHIRPFLEFLPLPAHRMLHEPREKIRFAYFLNHGLASIVVSMRDGRDVEAGVVGYEGFVGTALAVGLLRSPLCEIMQIQGDGFRIDAPAFQAALRDMPDFQLRLSRYAVVKGMQVAQTAACNRLHDVAQRLARWLLMAQDRIDAPTLRITHDFLATMLGSDRPSVTIAAGVLKRLHVIDYSRGSVTILNRKKLENSACSCYRAIQELNGELGLR